MAVTTRRYFVLYLLYISNNVVIIARDTPDIAIVTNTYEAVHIFLFKGITQAIGKATNPHTTLARIQILTTNFILDLFYCIYRQNLYPA